jgi:tRNA G18 (ribose-2'-O)-methylase SpoU
MNCADEMITIPKIGEAESLNAAVATSIMLYEFKR